MPFGNKAQPSKRFKYGAKTPSQKDLVSDQLYLAHKYGNDLVAIEKDRRKAYREVRNQLFPELTSLEVQIEEICEKIASNRQIINDERQKQRKLLYNEAIAKEIKLLEKERKLLSKKQKALCKETKKSEKLNELASVVDQEAAEKEKSLYHQYDNLYWGTKNQVRQNRVKRTGRDPRFHRYMGEGQLSQQIQTQKGGERLTFERLLSGKDTRAKLYVKNWQRRGAQGNESTKGTLWFRIGSEESKYKFIKVPIFLHRKLKLGEYIQWIHLIRRKVATNFKWEVQFVVSKENGWNQKLNGDKKITIDVGWKKIKEGLRVACCCGSDRKEFNLVIPNERLNRWKKVDDLKSIRAKNFNVVLKKFREWFKLYKNAIADGSYLQSKDWEGWERLTTLPHWKEGSSQNRLASVVNFWRHNRFAGDEEIFDYLESWRKQDKHLYDWEGNQRKNNLYWRKNFYRNWVLDVRKEYGTFGVEKVNWATLQKKEGPEKTSFISTSNRAIAAVGILREHIAETGDMVLLNAVNSSKKCNKCKDICDPDGKQQFHTCENCGETWDRDQNASRNLMDDWELASAPVTQKSP